MDILAIPLLIQLFLEAILPPLILPLCNGHCQSFRIKLRY